ncbi:aromatase/cyclase [Amycolatopsis sp. QT-25]|uniref:aromatase/cyclase n=1 Tax=Amycolatopsis sp. QT-25 TaxID=3034022 RepID=UPI0023EB46D3|nr:aromatase/cyclase [Amycolatopsis sp. QT-25]WET83079.1 aromatase/cyclase [Amycolatopsis sp. QT-25]
MTEYSTHSITVPAPVDQVYDLVAKAADWPALFPPTVHIEHLERGETLERFHIWALANNGVKDWVSRRTLDRVARVITFRQEVSRPPVAAMSGTWLFTPTADGGTAVELRHEYTPVDDDPGASAWIRQALDTNSAAELASLSRAAAGGAAAERVLRFSDSVRIAGPHWLAYEFIDEAQHWPERLPHVDDLDLTVDDDGAQRMTMTTIAPDGSRHTTGSTRIRLESSILYKQTTPPPLLSGHSGRWIFAPDGDSCVVTSEHTVAIDPDTVEKVLGTGKTLADARDFVRGALGGNSLITLRHARDFTESRATTPKRST